MLRVNLGSGGGVCEFGSDGPFEVRVLCDGRWGMKTRISETTGMSREGRGRGVLSLGDK